MTDLPPTTSVCTPLHWPFAYKALTVNYQPDGQLQAIVKLLPESVTHWVSKRTRESPCMI